MSPYVFILLALCSFRLTRLLTTDDITDFIRRAVDRRFGSNSNWSVLINCPWCAGVYVTTGVFVIHRYLWQPPVWLLCMVASMAIVGLLGTYDER